LKRLFWSFYGLSMVETTSDSIDAFSNRLKKFHAMRVLGDGPYRVLYSCIFNNPHDFEKTYYVLDKLTQHDRVGYVGLLNDAYAYDHSCGLLNAVFIRLMHSFLYEANMMPEHMWVFYNQERHNVDAMIEHHRAQNVPHSATDLLDTSMYYDGPARDVSQPALYLRPPNPSQAGAAATSADDARFIDSIWAP
jgi:hypothetical protein